MKRITIRFLGQSVFCVLALCILSSCSTAPVKPPVCQVPSVHQPSLPALRQDIMHTVGPGETLWRIGKMYDVTIEDIMKANGLTSREVLEMGQRLRIPQAAQLKPVIPLYPSKKWKYIIIHHSATDSGNALSIFSHHKQRGFTGVGYHFVVDNGTSGKSSGQIEVAPRWLKQQDGAHCRAAGMNEMGIGVCLVGNFSKERVGEEQLQSLVYLVKKLKEYYRVPARNILGHGQVRGAKTECPGTFFPWERFKSLLAAAHSE